MIIKRGDVLLVNFEPVLGSEQGKTRPCVVIQNNVGNLSSPTTIVAAITSNTGHAYPFTVKVGKGEGNLPQESLIMLHQLRTISVQHRIVKKMGSLSFAAMRKVDEALKVSLALE